MQRDNLTILSRKKKKQNKLGNIQILDDLLNIRAASTTNTLSWVMRADNEIDSQNDRKKDREKMERSYWLKQVPPPSTNRVSPLTSFLSIAWSINFSNQDAGLNYYLEEWKKIFDMFNMEVLPSFCILSTPMFHSFVVFVFPKLSTAL